MKIKKYFFSFVLTNEMYYDKLFWHCFTHLPIQPPLLEDCKLFETLFEGDMATQAKEEWEKAMSELAQEEPELLQHFQKLSEAAGKVGKAKSHGLF